MKQCRFEESAHLYPLGVLSAREKQEFQEHMRTCAECAKTVREVRSIGAMCKEMAVDEPSLGFERRVLESVRKRPDARRAGFDWSQFFGFNRAMLPVAACLTVVLLVAALFSLQLGSRNGAAMSARNAQQSASGDSYSKYAFSDAENDLIASDGETALKNYYKMLGNRM